MLITKLLYILTQGETLSSSETTEVREAQLIVVAWHQLCRERQFGHHVFLAVLWGWLLPFCSLLSRSMRS